MRRSPTYPVILALLLTVVFAACRRESLPESGEAIHFTVGPAVSVDMRTKADGLPSAEDDFKLSGKALYGVNEDEILFGPTELSYDDSDGKWYYSPLKYWDRNKTYDFRAVSPIGAVAAGGTAAKTGSVTARYGDYDLMVASNHGPAVMTPVALAFNHAGAAVRFLFKKGADESQTVTVSHFEVKNVYSAGTVTCAWDGTKDVLTPAPTPESRQSVFVWDETPGDDVRELTAAYQSFDGWHYVVPQTLGSDTTVEFTYRINSGTANYASLVFPAGSAWDPGKTYEYRIDIDKLTIDLSFTVDSWDTNVVEGSYTIRR